MERTLTLNEISSLQGMYHQYLLAGNKLFAFINVEGINLDLEDDMSQTQIFESYEAFLLAVTSKDDSIMNVSMTAKINIANYILYWKRKFMDAEKREDVSPEAKKNILQLIASKIVSYEEYASMYDMASKQHYIIVQEPVDHITTDALEAAEENLYRKAQEIMEEFNSGMQIAGKRLSMQLLTAEEILNVLQLFIDNKTVVFM